ncbi:unnamed protein product [Hydatigera taeniaeformis]|uniref:Kinesin-associated protein 3 n=1 Tax=Hydatigena taeniaeformis TaxID=6205 RepID=A0A0R3XBL3_HYDTA|nr:unnamed protein product [Hydatigera taeniaeformis]
MNSKALLTKRVRDVRIDVHPFEQALVICYKAEATILGESGDPVIGDKKECATKSPANEALADPGAFDSAKIDETANMADLDEYLDLLYEDTTEQLRSSALILQLARNPDNLEELFQNGTLCMSILERETQTYASWMEDLRQLRIAQGEDCLEYKQNAERCGDLIRKQEQLLRVAIYLLLNLAENVEVEEKMHRKGIVALLCRCLKRKNHDLVVLVVSFLRKLSLFQENIDEMDLLGMEFRAARQALPSAQQQQRRRRFLG